MSGKKITHASWVVTSTQNRDADDIFGDVDINTTKVTNATHTKDATGDGDLTIAAKAIEISMIDDGTDGELITWDAAGNAATVPVGTATHVLTSNGPGAAPTFQVGAGTKAIKAFTESIATDNTGAWVTRALTGANLASTKIQVSVNADGDNETHGVREYNSSAAVEKQCKKGLTIWQVSTDASKRIEIYSSHVDNVFDVVSYES